MRYLQSRRHYGEEYKFYIVENTSVPFIKVHTPENAFGYPDIVLYSPTHRCIYTLHRGLQEHIKTALMKQIVALYKKHGLPY